MILKNCNDGEKLDVAGLNEMNVLVDRSETAFTEIALNMWRPGLIGPPHFHGTKDQIFYVLSGQGSVILGGTGHSVERGSLLYVPAGMVHQSIAALSGPLIYLCMNVFLDSEKEGHASFAEHIEKMKMIRKLQAEKRTADVEGAPQTKSQVKPGKHVTTIREKVPTTGPRESETRLLDLVETGRCEVALMTFDAGYRTPASCDEKRELTCYIISGKGKISIDDKQHSIALDDVIFIPRSECYSIEAIDEDLVFLLLTTYTK